jgi:hypothetical protein
MKLIRRTAVVEPETGEESRVLAALLREVLATCQRIEVAVSAGNRRADRPRRRALDRWDVTLAETMAASTGGRVFTSAALLRHAEFDAALRAALADALVESPQQLGRWLRRVERAGFVGNVQVIRAKVVAAGLTWRAVRVVSRI